MGGLKTSRESTFIVDLAVSVDDGLADHFVEVKGTRGSKVHKGPYSECLPGGGKSYSYATGTLRWGIEKAEEKVGEM